MGPYAGCIGRIVSFAGYAVSAQKGFLFVRPAYESSALIFERELKIAAEAGFLGKNILGSDYSLDIAVHRSGGRYICGEGTAQLNAGTGTRMRSERPPILSARRLCRATTRQYCSLWAGHRGSWPVVGLAWGCLNERYS